MLQCVAESELQGVFHTHTIWRLPNVAVCCKECVTGSVTHIHCISCIPPDINHPSAYQEESMLQCVAVCCSVLQCVAGCVAQCVAHIWGGYD